MFSVSRTSALVVLLLLPVVASAAPRKYPITSFGAVGDGTTLNTVAIQSAIDHAATNGGGVVIVPEGIFVSGAIFFKAHVNLLVEKGGVLKGSTNLDDYPLVPTRWEGVEREWTAALINFFDLSGVELSGEGTIDGSGEQWQALFGRRKDQPGAPPSAGVSTAAQSRGRPRLIALQNCRDINVSGLHLKNQASWGLFLLYCQGARVENLVIRAEHDLPSSDGIDLDSCQHVLVTGCDIDVNDDCISIKSGKGEDGRRVNRPCEHIVIEKTRFGYGHGGVAMGSEVTGGIRHVEVRDCVVEDGNWSPIRFKSQPSRGGLVEDIIYRNIEIRDAKQAVEFNLEWRMVPPLEPPAKVLTQVRNVRLIHLTGNVNSVGVLHGLKDSPITDVQFEKCELKAQRGLILENTRDIDLKGLQLEVTTGEPVMDRNKR